MVLTTRRSFLRRQIEVADLDNLAAGTYRLGVKVSIDGFVTDVIERTIAVIEGN
jgi:hypothetical protein